MNKRIRAVRKLLDMSQKDFAEKIGLKQNAVSYMEKEGTKVTEQNIRAICSQFSVNEKWLRTGEGEVFQEGDRMRQEYFAIYSQLAPCNQELLVNIARNILESQQKLRQEEEKKMRLAE